MDDAFDTVKNQRVCAANATASRFPGRYICPVCQTEVAYAAGAYVSAHFRHCRGTDHEECERYSRNFHAEVPLARHEWEHLDAVLTSQTSTSQGQPFVSLAVRFRPAYAVKSVTFVSGRNSTPYVVYHNLRQQYFRISEAEENYLVKAHLPAGECEPHIVEGFRANPVVFRVSEREAVRLPSHRVLRPGGHLVISKEPLQPKFHSSLLAESCLTIPGLHATLIKIPEDPSGQVRHNIESILRFETAPALATYAFLAPMAVSELATDCWEIGKNEEVAVLVQLSRHLSPKPTQLLVQQRCSGHLSTEYLALQGLSDVFVIRAEAARESPDLYRIGLADPPRFILEITRSNETIEPECARLGFHFSTKSRTQSHFFWSAHEIPRALVEVSRSATDLISLKIPKSIEISISDRTGHRAVIPEKGAERELTNFLRQARFPCVLSATGYPSIILRPEKAPSRLLVKLNRIRDVVPRTRRDARLADAFRRGRVSPYTIGCLA